MSVFLFNDTATTEIYTLSLHDALPIFVYELNRSGLLAENEKIRPILAQLEKLLLCELRKDRSDRKSGSAGMPRPISYAVFCLQKNRKHGHQRSLQQNSTQDQSLHHRRP